LKDGIGQRLLSLDATVKDLGNQISSISQPLPILKYRVGSQVGGKFQKHTGAVTFWRASCLSCQREKSALIRLCNRKDKPLVVYSTRQEPELIPRGCQGGYGRDFALELGVSVVPTTLYFRSGKLIWYKQGYFAGLERVIKIFANMK
jgi:hypothetical protein